MQRWRQFTNAVLGVTMVLGMAVMPQLSKPANAQSPGDTRTVQQELGTRTDKLSDRTTSYDASTGLTTVKQKSNSVRLYQEKTEKYQQTGTTTRTQYQTVTKTRQNTIQVLKTGTRQVTTFKTQYRPVYQTVAVQVAKTGYRTENQLRYQAYQALGYHWVNYGTYQWRWQAHTGYKWTNVWYYQPGYWRGSWRWRWSWWACDWVVYYDCDWVDGYWYSECVLQPYTYYSCDLAWVDNWVYEGYWYTDWHWVYVPVTVAYTYYETQYETRPVYDTEYYSEYDWAWFPYATPQPIWQTVFIQASGWYDYAPYGHRWYNWCDCPYVITGYKYSYWGYGLVTKSRQVQRQEAYQVPVTTTETYTYYEPKTITVTYTETVPVTVSIPVYGWVTANDWTNKEQVTGSAWATVAKINLGSGNSALASSAGAKAASFLSDRGSGNSKEVLIGSRKRVLFQADKAIASVAKKKVEAGSLAIVTRIVNPTPAPKPKVDPTPAPKLTATPTPAPTATPSGDGDKDRQGDGDKDNQGNDDAIKALVGNYATPLGSTLSINRDGESSNLKISVTLVDGLSGKANVAYSNPFSLTVKDKKDKSKTLTCTVNQDGSITLTVPNVASGTATKQ